jgi:hypothetical protein
VAITGSALITVGFIGLSMLTDSAGRTLLFASCATVGAGMGMQMLSLLLAVQHGVPRSRLGIATSLNQFSRSIGAAVGVAAMGLLLARGLHGTAIPRTAEGTSNSVLNLSEPVRGLFTSALHQVFVSCAVVSGAGLVAALFLPAVDFGRGGVRSAGEEVRTSGLANLKPEDEPVVMPE